MYDLDKDAPIPEIGPDADGGLELGAPALLLRIEDAASRLGIARSMMYQLVRSGEVESVRVGRLRRIPVECLEEYVARLRAQPRAVSA